MQAKNQTRELKKIASPACLNQAHYSKKKKVKPVDGEERGTNSPG